jgi:hypothetical protein
MVGSGPPRTDPFAGEHVGCPHDFGGSQDGHRHSALPVLAIHRCDALGGQCVDQSDGPQDEHCRGADS